MAETLYRKYRPTTFAELVNQQHIRITLVNALAHDRLAHAYLFTGPRGIGKTTVARLLARAVNCPERKADGEPCNTCAACRGMLEGRNLDIVEIDAASQTGVDNVRENIIQSARSSPSYGKMKVFIIDEVHMLSLAAFNALLKLLEEPPAHAMFILATTEIHRVPETIISRTQRFDFKKLTVTEIAERLQKIAKLEKRKLEDGVAERIARFAGGSLRDAESMLGQLFAFQDTTVTGEMADLILPRSNEQLTTQIMQSLVNRQAAEAIRAFHAYCDEGGDIPVLVHELITMSRAVLLATVDPSLIDSAVQTYTQDTVTELLSMGKQISTSQATEMVGQLTEAERRLYRGAMLEVPLELAFAAIGLPVEERTAPIPPPDRPTSPPSATAGPKASKADAKPTKKPQAAKPTTKSLDLAAVKQAWAKAQAVLTPDQPSLRLSLQQAWIASVGPGVIHLGVPFELHRARLTDPKNRHGLEEKLSELLKTTVHLEVQVDGQSQQAAPPPPAKLDLTSPSSSDQSEKNSPDR